MPQLKWNEYDFIECLGILPEIQEYGISHSFELNQESFLLSLTVWQYESLVAISLFNEKKTFEIFELWFVVKREIEFVDDKYGSYLRFLDIKIVLDRFYDPNNKNFSIETNYSNNLNFELHTFPQFKLNFS